MSTAGMSFDSSALGSSRRPAAGDRRASIVMRREHSSSLLAFVNSHQSTVDNSLRFRSSRIADSSLAIPEEQEYAESNGNSSVMSNMDDIYEDDKNAEKKSDFMHRVCLKSNYTLKSQLLMSFGFMNFAVICVVVLICIMVTIFVGDDYKEINADTFSSALGQGLQGRTARYLAESLQHRLLPVDYVNLLFEMTRDRFAGYPDALFSDDPPIPFANLDGEPKEYPVVGPPTPLDWELKKDNFQLNDPGRREWYLADQPVSTENADFFFQGTCDPSITDPNHPAYYPGCTDENNDLITGGVVSPSNYTNAIYERAKDLAPILKAMFEYNADIFEVGIFFANQGAGATIKVPQRLVDGTNSFISEGCDWLDRPNPLDPSRPILDSDLTADCPPKGESVNGRDYNPLIREWCQRQALDPNQAIAVDGPYLDAFVEGNWLLSFGKAVFDPFTNEFVACTYVAVQVNFAESVLEQAILSNNSEISVTRFDQNATVVASSAFSIADANRVSFISELKIGLTEATYNDLYTLVDYDSNWDAADVKEAYQEYFTQAHGFAVTAHPIPPVPDTYEESYRPEYLAIVSISEADILAAVDDANEDVDDEVRDTVIFAVIVGSAGFAFSMVVLLMMASLLTLPLNEMNRVAKEIVESFGHRSADENAKLNIEPVKDERWVAKYCLPRTEILTLTERFNSMVKSFSGSLMTRTKKTKEIETPSCYKSSHEVLLKLYRSRKDLPFPMDFEEEEPEDKDIAKVGEVEDIQSGDENKPTPASKESLDSPKSDDEPLAAPALKADEHTIVFESAEKDAEETEVNSKSPEHQEPTVENVDNAETVSSEVGSDEISSKIVDGSIDENAGTQKETSEKQIINEGNGESGISEINESKSSKNENQYTNSMNGEAEEEKSQKNGKVERLGVTNRRVGHSYDSLILDEDAPVSSVFVPESPASEEWDRPLVNMGRNLVLLQSQRGKSSSMAKMLDTEKKIKVKSWGLRSPLFVWIVLLIIIPLLVTSILISAVVFATIRSSFVDSVRNSEEYFLSIEEFAMGVTAGLRAEFISSSSERAAADLYFMKRYAEWLLFGALGRSRPFPRVMTGVEECKNGDNATIAGCTWAKENYVCDCEWNWPEEQCMNFADDEESRRLQTPYFFVSTDNADSNGARSSTLYPSTHVAPDNTSWWSSPDVLPGSESGWNASGYMTSYDRLRVIAANPMILSLPNADYNKEVGTTFHIAFEDDGLVVSYDGCQASEHGWSAFWKSSEGNGAADLRPKLCPLGKHGYDPRCREWYATGAEIAKNGSGIYITAPYQFADGSLVGQSATSGMIDPNTGTHVGQVLVDFIADPIFDSLEPENTKVRPGGFPLMITSISDNFGRDTVVGPGVDRASVAKPVAQITLPYDVNCTAESSTACETRLSYFSEIANAMKSGETGVAEFTRTTQSGGAEEMVIAYAPSIIRFLEPTDSSDFGSGADPLRRVIYSIGIVQTKDSILKTFEATENDMNDQLKLATWVLVIFLFWAIVLVVWISYQVAHTISEPILYLVETVNSIVSLSDEEPPHLDRSKGSIEISNVSNTVHSLYRAVTLANKFFSAGEIEAAYNLLVDALALFERIDNKKAIGVAYNNLGNTLMIMYRQLRTERAVTKFGLSLSDIMDKGTRCFHEAIKLGETAYDEFYENEGWTINCLDFMQHLSNRYFNRAMFLLTIKDHHAMPAEAEKLGLRDLEISRDMDLEVIAYGEDIGWNTSARAESVFSVGLTRVRGYILLLEMGYPDEWEITDKLQDLYDLLNAESKKTKSDLFSTMNYTARLQEIETEVMRYTMAKEKDKIAVITALRPLFEDEYILFSTQSQAILALRSYINSDEAGIDEGVRRELIHKFGKMRDRLMSMYEKYVERKAVHGSVALSSVSESMVNVFEKSIEFVATGSKASAKRSNPHSALPDHLAWQIVTMEQF